MGKIKAKYTISWFEESSTYQFANGTKIFIPCGKSMPQGESLISWGQPEAYCKQNFQPFQEQTEITRDPGNFCEGLAPSTAAIAGTAQGCREWFIITVNGKEQRRWSVRCRGASTVTSREWAHQRVPCASVRTELVTLGSNPEVRVLYLGWVRPFLFLLATCRMRPPWVLPRACPSIIFWKKIIYFEFIAHQMERHLPKPRSHQGSLSIFNLHLRFLFCFVF